MDLPRLLEKYQQELRLYLRKSLLEQNEEQHFQLELALHDCIDRISALLPCLKALPHDQAEQLPAILAELEIQLIDGRNRLAAEQQRLSEQLQRLPAASRNAATAAVSKLIETQG